MAFTGVSVVMPPTAEVQYFTSIPAGTCTCVCLCVCLHPPVMVIVLVVDWFWVVWVWVRYWPSGQQVGVHLDISDEGNAHASASRISSHRVGGRASQQQAAWSQKRRWPLPSLA